MQKALGPLEQTLGLPPATSAPGGEATPLTLYASPAISRYWLMAEFWYTKQEPCWPHCVCQSRHALSITQPKAMGPGMPPAERGTFSTPTACGGVQRPRPGGL